MNDRVSPQQGANGLGGNLNLLGHDQRVNLCQRNLLEQGVRLARFGWGQNQQSFGVKFYPGQWQLNEGGGHK